MKGRIDFLQIGENGVDEIFFLEKGLKMGINEKRGEFLTLT